ncbi:unnamed protein product [Cladocopium goreaui]|uniref:Uncharacterized protein n=1 Tax=Cladocopium goreaui TaxID=2562237 RepID=A0A9P1FRM9_9DINO|nr:unnamed protein product [Cladocopium goreaui]
MACRVRFAFCPLAAAVLQSDHLVWVPSGRLLQAQILQGKTRGRCWKSLLGSAIACERAMAAPHVAADAARAELQAGVARKMLASMPDRAKQIIFDGDFGGSQLDLAANYVWIRPLAESFPEVVPGGILLTDIWLYLDRLLGFKLLVLKDVPKVNQAATEAGRCKKLMGALRYLYRNSLTSHHPRVTELKSLLRPSPMSRVSCWGQVQLYLTRFFLATCLICRNLCFSMCCLCHPYRPGVRERCSLQCGWRACLMLSLMGRWGFCQTHLF